MKRNGSIYLAETLRQYGTSHVFLVPAVLMQALAEIDRAGIKRIVAHTEKAAAYMADGFARASGKPGICMAQAIGGSNLAAGLRDPWMAGSPVIAMTGGPRAMGRYRNYYQEMDDHSQFAPTTKFNVRVDELAQLPNLLRQAFREATTGTPGPVHIEFAGPNGELTERDAELEDGVQAEFAQAPAFRPEPNAEQIEAAAAALLSARRPVIVAGGGVVWSGAQEEVVELAELLNIPVATSLNAKGAILDTHALSVGVTGTYSRECANRVVARADLVLFVGSRTGSQVTTNWKIPAPETTIVQIDIEPREIGRNYRNTVPVHGDAKIALRRLIEYLRGKKPAAASAWPAEAADLVKAWRDREEPLRASNAMPMRPERLCRAISNVLPEGGIVVSDTGHSGMWSGAMIDFAKPGQRFIRCAGSLGWSLPASIGIKCALPDKAVVCFNGDGAAHYHISEMETAARHGINAVVVVNNNAAFNQEIPLAEAAYGKDMPKSGEELWRLRQVDFAKVADAFGCLGLSVTDPQELESTLEQALDAGRPVLVDVATDVNAMARRAWTPEA